MADEMNQTLDLPRFPPLRRREFHWTGRATLSSWTGFQSRLGSYGSATPGVADGTVRVMILAAESGPPTPEQAAAYEYLLAHQNAVRDTLVAAILEGYPMIRQNVLGDGVIEPHDMPEHPSPDDLKGLVGLAIVHILGVTKDGVAYTGYEFGCTWDDEHSLGVMMHQGRVVEFPENGIGKVNGADLASESWLAEEDANSLG